MTSWQTPDHLTGHAADEWPRIVDRLKAAGVLELVEPTAVAAYCRAYANWREAEQFIEQHGISAELRNDKGELKNIIEVPHVKTSKAMAAQMTTFLRDCGLTPKSQGQLKRPADDQRATDRDSVRERAFRIIGKTG